MPEPAPVARPAPPTVLATVLAIDVGSTWCKVAYVDRTGAVVAEGRAYCRGGGSFGPGAAALRAVEQALVTATQAASRELVAAGRPVAPAAIGLSCRGVIGLWL